MRKHDHHENNMFLTSLKINVDIATHSMANGIVFLFLFLFFLE